MARVTIYLDDSLRERVRRADLPVSHLCQEALRLALAERGEPLGREEIAGQLAIGHD